MAKNWNLEDLAPRYQRQLQGDNPNPEYPEPLESKPKRKNAQPEKALQKVVMAYAQLRGWRTLHVPPVQCVAGTFFTPYEGQGKGFPDLLMLRSGSPGITAELKHGGNTTTPEQDIWLRLFVEAGFHVYIWTLDDWQSGEIERVLR